MICRTVNSKGFYVSFNLAWFGILSWLAVMSRISINKWPFKTHRLSKNNGSRGAAEALGTTSRHSITTGSVTISRPSTCEMLNIQGSTESRPHANRKELLLPFRLPTDPMDACQGR